MLKVAITGGIGSGKSLVSKVFSLYNIPLYNADIAAKRIMQSDAVVIQQLKLIFGNELYKEGRLDRPFLASLVFSNSNLLQQLNAVVHPAIALDYANWHDRQNAPYTIKEAAILFESGSDKEIDFVIGVTAPLQLRIQRTMQRDHISETQVMSRIQNQMDDAQKMALCNAVIHNDNKQSVLLQVALIHNTIIHLT